jgi:hypothetical protein
MQCGGKGSRESTRLDYAVYSATQPQRSQSEPMKKGMIVVAMRKKR